MSRGDDVRLAARLTRALARGGVLRPVAPGKLRRAVAAGRALGATPAAPVAIAAALDPDGPAVIDEAGTVSWSELDSRARRIAEHLAREHGAGPDQPVAVMCRNHRYAIESIAAAAHLGADVLLLSTELSAGQLDRVLERHSAGVVIHDAEFGDRISGVVAWHDGDATGEALDALGASGPLRAEPPPRRSRIVILTSGTTGTPKAAARDLPPRAMAGPLLAMIEHFGLRRGAPVVIGPPLYHGFGLGFASAAHGIGAPIVLRRRFEPEAALEAIAEHRASCFVGVPVMLERILRADHALYDLGSLRAVVSAGARLPPQLSEAFMDAFGERLYNAYGSTETGFGSFATPADLRAAPGTIGRAPYGTVLRVLDEDRRPAPPGETGHIFIGGDLVIEGYVGGGGSKESVAGMMNTGDLGHADLQGRMFVDGREDDMIVSGGENVFPQEVEDVLADHPAVKDLAVIGVPDDEFGQRLRAFVVASGDPGPDELLAYLRERLERYKLPREIVFRDEIPRNATGKTLRRVLAEEGGADRAEEGAR